jgi:DNA-binding transcriptional LysR family regulator
VFLSNWCPLLDTLTESAEHGALRADGCWLDHHKVTTIDQAGSGGCEALPTPAAAGHRITGLIGEEEFTAPIASLQEHQKSLPSTTPSAMLSTALLNWGSLAQSFAAIPGTFTGRGGWVSWPTKMIVLPQWSTPEGVVHLVFTTTKGMLPAVRAFVDHFAEAFSTMRGRGRMLVPDQNEKI